MNPDQRVITIDEHLSRSILQAASREATGLDGRSGMIGFNYRFNPREHLHLRWIAFPVPFPLVQPGRGLKRADTVVLYSSG